MDLNIENNFLNFQSKFEKKYIKKQIFIVYPNESNSEIDEILKSLIFDKCIIYESETDIFEKKIKDFNCVIFCLNKDNTDADNEKIKMMIQYSESTNKVILLLWLSTTADDIKHCKLSNLEKYRIIILDNLCNKEALHMKQLYSFIERILVLKPNLNQKSFGMRLFSIEKVEQVKTNLLSKEFVCLLSNDEIIIKTKANTLKFYNMETGNLVGEIITGWSSFAYCWIDHLKKVFIVESNSSHAKLFDKNGNLFQNITLKCDNVSSSISCLAYSATSNCIIFCKHNTNGYFVCKMNENFEIGEELSIKGRPIVFNDHIYAIYDSYLYIYDLSFNCLKYIDNKFSIITIFCDVVQPKFVFIKSSINSINVLSTIDFSVVGTFNHKHECVLVRNKKIVFSKSSGSITVYLFYKLQVKNYNSFIDSQFLCKINPFNIHIYEDPYLLPCQNSVCFKCMSSSSDILQKTFKCYFGSCQTFHEFSDKIVQDLKTADLIGRNTEKLLTKLSCFGLNFIDSLGNIIFHVVIISIRFFFFLEFTSSYEKKFDFIEFIINIRLQSLKNEIEKYAEKSLKFIDVFEKSLISNKVYSNSYSSAKKIGDIKMYQVGIFYNEYEKDWGIPYYPSIDAFGSETFDNDQFVVSFYKKTVFTE